MLEKYNVSQIEIYRRLDVLFPINILLSFSFHAIFIVRFLM